MKVKAIIMRADRTNDVIVVPKKKIEGKTFRHKNVTYFLHPDRFQVTWKWAWGRKWYYSTYYYTEGISNPLPVPDFKKVVNPDGTISFPKVMDNGIAGEELAAIFNPWFYRIIAAQAKNTWEQVQFYISIGTLLGVAYLLWQQINEPGATPLAPPVAVAAPSPTPRVIG